MEVIFSITLIVDIVVLVISNACFFHQTIYFLIAMMAKRKKVKASVLHHYGVLISARNEESVIGQLIQSLRRQNYPAELIDIFVVADNCNDNTADVARDAGAYVTERFNDVLVGKGYALDETFRNLLWDPRAAACEGFFVFDADNLVHPDFVMHMNDMFDHGSRVITSYRNAKNFGHNWISAGYGIWFMRDAYFMGNARMALGLQCPVYGTGFLVHRDIIAAQGGFPHDILTEDTQFTMEQTLKGEKIDYCNEAEVYDEEPVTFKDSWKQRKRWVRGTIQAFEGYGERLFKKIFKEKSVRRGFSCFDMLMYIGAPTLFTIMTVIITIGCTASLWVGIFNSSPWMAAVYIGRYVYNMLIGFYGLFFFYGICTIITQWKRIHTSGLKKVLYVFTFPIFTFSYMLVMITNMFVKQVKWEPIKHVDTRTIDEIDYKKSA